MLPETRLESELEKLWEAEYRKNWTSALPYLMATAGTAGGWSSSSERIWRSLRAATSLNATRAIRVIEEEFV
jgi:hypothetical protein